MALSSPLGARRNQALEQDVLGLCRGCLIDLPRLPRRLDLHQLRLDRAFVVQLALSLLIEALGDPDRSPDRSQRKRQEPGDQAHAFAVSVAVSPVKLYGGSGPTYRRRIRPASSCPSALTASLNASTRSSSTRNAALTAPSGVDGGSRRASSASGLSRSKTSCASRSGAGSP